MVKLKSYMLKCNGQKYRVPLTSPALVSMLQSNMTRAPITSVNLASSAAVTIQSLSCFFSPVTGSYTLINYRGVHVLLKLDG